MRKLSKQAAEAFIEGRAFKSGNTEVKVDGVDTLMYLHGNLIAKRCGNHMDTTLSGWNTTTTKDRLNAILFLTGFGNCYHTVKGKAKINGCSIDPFGWQGWTFYESPVYA